MKITLERVGPHTCLPLPKQVAEAPGYEAGMQVDVSFDEGHRRLTVRPLSRTPLNGSGDPGSGDPAPALEEFIEQYTDALMELAADDHALSDGG